MTRLEAYRRISGLTLDDLGKKIGRAQPQVVRYCKPRSDPKHNTPQWPVGEALKQLTFGVIDLGNYADEVTPAEAAEMMAEIARREAASQLLAADPAASGAGAAAPSPRSKGEVTGG